ncbi:MAG: response regulator [Caldimonas sp.]
MLRILVVEDNPDLRETLPLLLEAPGRVIAACADAECALQAFDAEPFEVVITDVNLPGLSGTELAARVHARWPETWIVLSSGGDVPRPAGSAMRVTRYLAKPFTMAALDALMAEFEGAGAPGS